MRIRLIIQYDGTSYVGWQTQPNGVSVQAVIEKELEKLFGTHVALHGSGRTDSGVHAMAQVAHFDTPGRIPPEKISYALNAGLPNDIRIKHSSLADDDFHARFDAKKKFYRYAVLTTPHNDAFLYAHSLHVHSALDEAKMCDAASKILGTHDFSAFKSADCTVKSAVRSIYESSWERRGDLLYYTVGGNGFLYNMVRILVGTMLDVGMGKKNASDMARALSSGNREDAGATAPAKGLTLMRVVYDGFDTADYV